MQLPELIDYEPAVVDRIGSDDGMPVYMVCGLCHGKGWRERPDGQVTGCDQCDNSGVWARYTMRRLEALSGIQGALAPVYCDGQLVGCLQSPMLGSRPETFDVFVTKKLTKLLGGLVSVDFTIADARRAIRALSDPDFDELPF